MRQLSYSRSILVFWQDLVFVEAALLADDITKDLAPIITVVLDEFPQILKLDLDTRRTVTQAQARAYVADALIDEGLRGLFYAVLALVGQNRTLPQFTTLFDSHIGDVVRHALKRQVDVAAVIIGKLTLKIFPGDLQTKHTGVLVPLIERGKKVLAEVLASELTRVGGRLDVKAWKQEVNAARLTVYGQLLGIAAQTGRKKAWADGFFPKVAAADGEDEALDDSAQTEAPEAPPAGDKGKPE
jgi:hypothetical protein